MSQPFDFADLVEEASERAGGEATTAADVYSLQRSLYLIQQDWMQKGYPTWKITTVDIGISGVAPEVQLPDDVDDVIQVNSMLRNSDHEQPMRRITADEYARLTTKSTAGRPVQFYLKRTDPPVLYVYPVGAAYQTNYLRVTYIQRPAEFERYAANSDVPGRWTRALVQALALELAKKRPPYNEETIARLERELIMAEDRAGKDDRDRSVYRVRI